MAIDNASIVSSIGWIAICSGSMEERDDFGEGFLKMEGLLRIEVWKF